MNNRVTTSFKVTSFRRLNRRRLSFVNGVKSSGNGAFSVMSRYRNAKTMISALCLTKSWRLFWSHFCIFGWTGFGVPFTCHGLFGSRNEVSVHNANCSLWVTVPPLLRLPRGRGEVLLLAAFVALPVGHSCYCLMVDCSFMVIIHRGCSFHGWWEPWM